MVEHSAICVQKRFDINQYKHNTLIFNVLKIIKMQYPCNSLIISTMKKLIFQRYKSLILSIVSIRSLKNFRLKNLVFRRFGSNFALRK